INVKIVLRTQFPDGGVAFGNGFVVEPHRFAKDEDAGFTIVVGAGSEKQDQEAHDEQAPGWQAIQSHNCRWLALCQWDTIIGLILQNSAPVEAPGEPLVETTG